MSMAWLATVHRLRRSERRLRACMHDARPSSQQHGSMHACYGMTNAPGHGDYLLTAIM